MLCAQHILPFPAETKFCSPFGMNGATWTWSTEQTCVLFGTVRSKDFWWFSWFLSDPSLADDFFYTYILCFSVRLYAINVKAAEPIGPKIFEATHMIPEKVSRCSKLQKCVSKMLIFVKFWNHLIKRRNFFVLQRNRAQWKAKLEDGRKAPGMPSLIIFLKNRYT